MTRIPTLSESCRPGAAADSQNLCYTPNIASVPRSKLPFGAPAHTPADRAQRGEMQRTVARFLVLVLLVGMFGPLALAVATPTSAAAHCQRQPAPEKPHHHCHEGMAGSAETSAPPAALKNNTCCVNHECCRPLVRSQWAHFSASLVPLGITVAGALPAQPSSAAPRADLRSYSSVRAPPLL
jgi:hypothetical protein